MPLPLRRTAFDIAQRYAGWVEERPGAKENHPLIVAGLELCGLGRNQPDEVPWCSAILNLIAWHLKLPRSANAAARSWLRVGLPIDLEQAEPGFDVVVLKRGPDPQPGPDVIAAPGHVGLFARLDGDRVEILGGNQSDAMTIAAFPASAVLGVRRLE